MATDFTIADVLAWARTKPADEAYSYFNSRICALAQYSVAKGLPVFSEQRSTAEEYRNLGKHLVVEPHTFGALVKRLGALIPAEHVSDTWTKRDAYGSVETLVREFAV